MFTQTEIDSLTRRITKQFSPKKIFLFGSYAFDTPNVDSDLDLCIVTDLEGKRKLDIIRAVRREISAVLHGALDILVYGTDEFTQRSAVENTLENKILNDGKLLHG